MFEWPDDGKKKSKVTIMVLTENTIQDVKELGALYTRECPGVWLAAGSRRKVRSGRTTLLLTVAGAFGVCVCANVLRGAGSPVCLLYTQTRSHHYITPTNRSHARAANTSTWVCASHTVSVLRVSPHNKPLFIQWADTHTKPFSPPSFSEINKIKWPFPLL